ncbi:VanW family protein [Patescibacteria group bacterium]|nr:VanW family protein [Patescibacteria group bacterium]
MLKSLSGKLHLNNALKKVIVFMYVTLGFVILYHVFYARKIISGVKVGSVYVGGMNFSQAKKALEDFELGKVKEFNVLYKDKEYRIAASSIDLTYDWEGVVTRAFEVGRTGDILVDTKDKIAGLFKTLYIGSYYDYSDDLLNVAFSTIRGEVNEAAVDAGLKVEGDGLIITPSKEGKKVDTEALFKVFTYSFDRMDFSDKNLPVSVVNPGIKEADLEQLVAEVEGIVTNNLKVKYEKKEWKPDMEQKLSFLGFVKKGTTLDMKLNSLNFDPFVDEVSSEINKLPRGKVTKVDGTRVVDFEIIEEGTEVDAKKFTDVFKDAFFGKKSEVEVPILSVSGPETKDKYGIYSLLGEGTSKFTGSSQGRINNLTLAAERTSGVLVSPGEVYSMNEAVGKINASTGYDVAYIISEGRTVLGSGGGVCQTSTTLFRAVLNSGLPVVSRTPHAYRVYYYEIESKPGIDATVYQPSVDFKFRNDTPNYVLIQTSWDLKENILSFKIYGTPDGREVELSDVTLTGESPPPAPSYQEDPTLPKGVIKQVDFPAWGGTATFTRTVTRNEEILFEESYTTRYQPWRAVYLVGTKE